MGGVLAHRYMAPLFIKQPCLKCHAELGYKLGDVRGRISVTMPADRYPGIRATQRQRAVLTLAGPAWPSCSAAFRRQSVRAAISPSAEVSAGQERLIAERTQALSAAKTTSLRDGWPKRKRQVHRFARAGARYRSVIETSQNAFTPSFRHRFPSSSLPMGRPATLLGLEMSQIIGQPLLAFVAGPGSGISRAPGATLPRRAGGRLPRAFTSPARTVRTRRWAMSSPRPSTNRRGHAQWVFSVKDITERLADEQALQISAAVMERCLGGHHRHRCPPSTSSRLIGALPRSPAIGRMK